MISFSFELIPNLQGSGAGEWEGGGGGVEAVFRTSTCFVYYQYINGQK